MGLGPPRLRIFLNVCYTTFGSFYATFGSLAGKTVRRRILTIGALTGSGGSEVIEAVVDCLNVALT